MSKYLLSAAAAAALLWSAGPVLADHTSCPGGHDTVLLDTNEQTIVVDTLDGEFRTQGYSPQGIVRSPNNQGTSGYSTTQDVLQDQEQSISNCVNTGNQNVHPHSPITGDWVDVGEEYLGDEEIVPDSEFGPADSRPGA